MLHRIVLVSANRALILETNGVAHSNDTAYCGSTLHTNTNQANVGLVSAPRLGSGFLALGFRYDGFGCLDVGVG